MSQALLWQLWTPYAGDTAESRDEWARLIARWSEPHRGYHTLEHLLLMLTLLAEQRAAPETMLAAWYHDAIYDPTSGSNEHDSAELARESLKELGLAIYASRVAELIELTATHDCPPGDEQAALLLDADLAILGQPPALYLRYVDGVRREYAHVSDDEFRTARADIMRGFLARDRIYLHPAFDSLEAKARANVTAELSIYGDAAGDDTQQGNDAE